MYLLNEDTLKAICWTLVHSLWQGTILAVLAGVVILATKKSTSISRYNILSSLFLLFMVAVGVTLYIQVQDNMSDTPVGVPAATEMYGSFQNRAFTGVSDAGVALAESSVVLDLVDFFNKNASLLVVFWFVIFCIKCFRVFGGLGHIYRIRNYKTSTPPIFWIERLNQLRTLLKIKGRVRMLESRLVSVPSVTGIFKPIVLVPIGLLNNLSQQEVEAILLHELAHIRRRDYFVNIVQSFAETVFFFNPGVLWLSSLIRDERENCCDDLAIAVTQSKKNYVNALVTFQEYNMNNSRLAMGFGGKKSHLLHRARRILLDNNKSLSKMEKTFLAICLMLVSFLTIEFTNAQDNMLTKYSPFKGPEDLNTLAPVSNMTDAATEADTVVPFADREYNPADFSDGTFMEFTDMYDGHPQSTYLIKRNDTLFQITGDIRIFKINGKEIPQEQMGPYRDIISSLMDKMEEYRDFAVDHEMSEAEARKLEAEAMARESEAVRLEGEAKRLEAEALIHENEERRHTQEARNREMEAMAIDRQEEARNRIRSSEDQFNEARKRQEEAEIRMEEAERRQEEAKVRMEDAMRREEEARVRMDEARVRQEEARVRMEQSRDRMSRATVTADVVVSDKQRNTSNNYKSVSESKIMVDGVPKTTKTRIVVESLPINVEADKTSGDIIKDLIKAGIIKNQNNLSYKLGNDELVVNGKKQPEDIHNKLKKKYLKNNAQTTYYYEYKMND